MTMPYAAFARLFRHAAQRFFWIWEIRLRAAALSFPRRFDFATISAFFGGLSRLGCVEMPFKALMALSTRFRSAVSTATIC